MIVRSDRGEKKPTGGVSENVVITTAAGDAVGRSSGIRLTSICEQSAGAIGQKCDDAIVVILRQPHALKAGLRFLRRV